MAEALASPDATRADGTVVDKAVFSIYRRASEVPLYRIEKEPRRAKKQGLYSVVVSTGLILKRGHEIHRVLDVLDRRLKVVAN